MTDYSLVNYLEQIARKHPEARIKHVLPKVKQEMKRKEVLAALASRPKSETTIRRMMRGIAEFMARIG